MSDELRNIIDKLNKICAEATIALSGKLSACQAEILATEIRLKCCDIAFENASDYLLKINTDIPGWTKISKLKLLAHAAMQVQENGCIVEIGSFNGRSSYAMGANKLPGVELHCFDSWSDTSGKCIAEIYGLMFGDLTQVNDYKSFRHNMKEVENLYHTQVTFPSPETRLNKVIDLMFIDAAHDNVDVINELFDNWVINVRSGGMIIFDDYDKETWPMLVEIIDHQVATGNFTAVHTMDLAILYKI